MSELKKMTEKQLLGMTLAELGFSISQGILKQGFASVDPIDLGIKLTPEAPEVTQETLQLFWDKFEAFPMADFMDMFGKVDSEGILIMVGSNGHFVNHNHLFITYRECIVTDKRWPEIAEEV